MINVKNIPIVEVGDSKGKAFFTIFSQKSGDTVRVYTNYAFDTFRFAAGDVVNLGMEEATSAKGGTYYKLKSITKGDASAAAPVPANKAATSSRPTATDEKIARQSSMERVVALAIAAGVADTLTYNQLFTAAAQLTSFVLHGDNGSDDVIVGGSTPVPQSQKQSPFSSPEEDDLDDEIPF